VDAAQRTEDFYRIMKELIQLLGDNHSVYMTPQEVDKMLADARGTEKLSGIGAVIQNRKTGFVILKFLPGGPAELAGLKLHEVITHIDGKAVTDPNAFGPAGPFTALLGTEGSTVNVTVQSLDNTVRTVSVTRRSYASGGIPNVVARVIPGTAIGYLQIDSFLSNTLEQDVQDSIQNLTAQNVTSLIVDVRSNGGGLIQSMLNVLAMFIDGGTIGTARSRTISEPLVIPSGHKLTQIPIVVLVDGQTASAAEMFASGMQTNNRATILGQPSQGNTENLSDMAQEEGSKLLLATYVFYRPDDTMLEGKGVQPDTMIAQNWWEFPADQDPFIQAAVAALSQR
jgi:C-terminal peptidase prc